MGIKTVNFLQELNEIMHTHTDPKDGRLDIPDSESLIGQCKTFVNGWLSWNMYFWMPQPDFSRKK